MLVVFLSWRPRRPWTSKCVRRDTSKLSREVIRRCCNCDIREINRHTPPPTRDTHPKLSKNFVFTILCAAGLINMKGKVRIHVNGVAWKLIVEIKQWKHPRFEQNMCRNVDEENKSLGNNLLCLHNRVVSTFVKALVNNNRIKMTETIIVEPTEEFCREIILYLRGLSYGRGLMDYREVEFLPFYEGKHTNWHLVLNMCCIPFEPKRARIWHPISPDINSGPSRPAREEQWKWKWWWHIDVSSRLRPITSHTSSYHFSHFIRWASHAGRWATTRRPVGINKWKFLEYLFEY